MASQKQHLDILVCDMEPVMQDSAKHVTKKKTLIYYVRRLWRLLTITKRKERSLLQLRSSSIKSSVSFTLFW